MSDEAGMKLWSYQRSFSAAGHHGTVEIVSRLSGLTSLLTLNGMHAASDHTPAAGADAVRNHRLAVTLEDGRELEVEAGYINWVNTAIAVRVNGELVHESHPGRTIAYPARAARMITAQATGGGSAYDPAKLERNKIPILVDIATALIFFVVAKVTDLRTAALAGAGVGIALVVAQRFIRVDIIGGMALFGIVMLLISAGFAMAFEDDEIIKQRSTIVGLIGASFFLVDGLLGGKRLGRGLSRYIAYSDVDPQRLAYGMGVVGAVIAIINYVVVKLVSTEVWLFYTTFGDIPLGIGLVLLAVKWARSCNPERLAAPA